MGFITEINKFNIIITVLINMKYVESKENKIGCILYKKTLYDIDKSSKIIINNGRITINRTYNKKISFVGSFILRKNSKLLVNGKFNIYQGPYISIGDNATLEVGKDSSLNSNCKLICHNNIKIGNSVLIADNVTIIDSDMHKIIGQELETSKPIIIGNHVWIGDGARIMKGVTIGDGAIVT